MKIKKGTEEAYKNWYDKNLDPYGHACFTYAERWAEMMESKINESESAEKAIVEHAESLSHEANEEGITGFMYGVAVEILSCHNRRVYWCWYSAKEWFRPLEDWQH